MSLDETEKKAWIPHVSCRQRVLPTLGTLALALLVFFTFPEHWGSVNEKMKQKWEGIQINRLLID